MIALVRRRQEMPVRKQDDDDFQNKLHLSKIDFHTPPLCGKALFILPLYVEKPFTMVLML